jgi:murein DD-endopeptidase MepM/ murein hydrolase activator NlpD
VIRTAAFLMLSALPAAADPAVTVQGVLLEDVSILTRGAAPGEMILIAVGKSPGVAAPTGTLRGRPLAFYPVQGGGYAALAGFDLDVATGPARLDLVIGGHASSRPIMVRYKAFPTTQLKVDDRFVRLSPADQARVDREQARTKAIYAASGTVPLFRGRFVSPIPGATSARFGERRVFNGVPKDPHNGADLRAAQGEPVHAPAAGRVVLAADLFYSGGTVILDHGMGLFSIYAHLSRIDAVENASLREGEVLGLVGKTGRATGPHLHWGVKLSGDRIDPFSVTALPLERFRP